MLLRLQNMSKTSNFFGVIAISKGIMPEILGQALSIYPLLGVKWKHSLYMGQINIT